jgi:hypothetical protein
MFSDRLRVEWWTLRAARQARRRLSRPPFETEDIDWPRVPKVASAADRHVGAVLDERGYSCLVSAVVRQAWLLAQGIRRDLVIGVTDLSEQFGAHAWLEGDPPCHDGFHELLRRPAP